MSTLLGFIQTLLMLTQSRLMPDMSKLFAPEPVISSVTTYIVTGNEVKNIETCRLYTEGLQRRSKDEWQPPVANNRKDLFRRPQQNTRWPDQAQGIIKRYLFFCS